jgi:hypothetical protein
VARGRDAEMFGATRRIQSGGSALRDNWPRNRRGAECATKRYSVNGTTGRAGLIWIECWRIPWRGCRRDPAAISAVGGGHATLMRGQRRRCDGRSYPFEPQPKALAALSKRH